MNCFFCKTKKNVIKQSYFSTKCLVCNLEMSNLQNKFGADVKGIESLRIKNFKDPYNREGIELKKVNIDETYPKYILNNLDELSDFITE